MAVCALRALSAQPPGVAGQHQNRAASLLLNHDFEAAITELRQAAAHYKAAESWSYYFSCLNQITKAQLELGQLDAAKQSAKKALWQSIETLSRNNDEAAKAAHKLGQVYEAAHRYEDAMECHRMGYDIREDLFSQQHPQTAASLIFMAVAARKQEAFEDAADFLEKAEDILAHYYEDNHPELSKVWEERGILFEYQNLPDQSRHAYKQAIAILKAFPNQYPEVLGRNWCRLARLLPEGERAQAYQRAYHLFEANERMQNSFAGEAALELANEALNAGQPALAVQIGERVLRNPGTRNAVHPQLAKAHLLLGHFEPALTHFRSWISRAPDALQPADWANAAELALGYGKASEALYWSKQFAERSEGLLPRYYVARAYASLGNETRARQILNQIIRSPEPPITKVLGEEAMGYLELDNGDTESAIEHFKSALRQADGYPFGQIRMRAALGLAHTSMAKQDRYAVDNLTTASIHFSELQEQLGHLLSTPLTPFEAAWVQQSLENIIEGGLQHLFLQQQYASQDFSVEVAYDWFEFAKVALFNFHSQPLESAPVFWKFRSHRLENAYPYSKELISGATSAVAEAWASYNSEQAQQLRYTVERKPLQAFEEVLASLKFRSYHYWVAGEHLYVLQLKAGTGQLYRKNIEAVQDGQSVRLSHHTLFPDWEALGKEETRGVLLFPTHKLVGYLFNQEEVGKRKLLKPQTIYRHWCAASFMADLATADQLPGAGAAAYYFQAPELGNESNAAVAMPTSHHAVQNCFPALEDWLNASADFTAIQVPGENTYAHLLLVPDARSAKILAGSIWPKTKYIVLDGAYTDHWGNSTTGIINRIRSQQHFAGTFIEQEGLCREPETYTNWLETMSTSPNPVKELGDLQAQPDHQVLKTVQIFGAPYEQPIGKTSEIPVFWILGGVFGLILTGLWVRR